MTPRAPGWLLLVSTAVFAAGCPTDKGSGAPAGEAPPGDGPLVGETTPDPGPAPPAPVDAWSEGVKENAAPEPVPDALPPDLGQPEPGDVEEPVADTSAAEPLLDARAPEPAVDVQAPDTAEPGPPSTCEVAPMTTLYSGLFPPNPYAPLDPLPGCVTSGYGAIIVLGCPTQDDGSPAACQVDRADLAVQLRDAGFANDIIVSGAAVQNQYVEAETLQALLLERGVPDAAIWPEPKAEHTDENLYYSTKIMETQGWTAAVVLSDGPGQLVYTAICDSNCCVDLGRLTLFGHKFDGQLVPTTLGHYVRYPVAAPVTEAECQHIEFATKAMCIKLADRKACKDDFQLQE